MSTGDLERIRGALPGYDVGEELGRGGWGVVLGGRHRQLDREVAIKQLPGHFASDPLVRSRFVSECRLLASLDHPHIVPVYDFVELDDLCLLVMEKLPGGTVWDRFRSRGVTTPTACAIALATASGLHHAHERGILHRDIKPENLLLAATGALKVSDFGIAKVIGGSRTVGTRAGDVLGTPAYMSPEQASGETLGPTTDVYSLAVVLYELLSGQLPFAMNPDESPLAVLLRHVTEDPVPLASVAPEVPCGLRDVVSRGLARSPAERPASAEAFGIELAEAAGRELGPGWFEQAEMPLMAATSLLAATKAPPPATDHVGPSEPSEPAEGPATQRRMQPAPRPRADTDRTTAAVDRGDLVPVAELARRAHEDREVELLRAIRSGTAPFHPADVEDAERLLGGHGATVTARCGLPADASRDEILLAVQAALARWQRRAENPLLTRPQADAARVAIRTCEGMLASLV